MKHQAPTRKNTEFDFNELAYAVLWEMGAQDIGQNEIARRTGVCKATMSRLMNGNPVDLISVLRICDYIHRSITDFIKV